MQRTCDIFFSLLAIILLSPFLILISIILKFTGEGEILFKQDRVGKKKKLFQVYKFATMLKNSPLIGSKTITLYNDNRILPLGFILRKTKINELPQLFNIFLGDMSVVGPRPLTEENFSKYNKIDQAFISQVTPGLSGVGSIIFRNEEKVLLSNEHSREFYDKVISPYKSKLERWYIKKKSIKIYFLIIFLTLWVIFFSKSNLIWKIFTDLPNIPDELKDRL
jgi:lipopolysaccharide/colanic/teichoic acid biosynthesis glycosyltransferase